MQTGMLSVITLDNLPLQASAYTGHVHKLPPSQQASVALPEFLETLSQANILQNPCVTEQEVSGSWSVSQFKKSSEIWCYCRSRWRCCCQLFFFTSPACVNTIVSASLSLTLVHTESARPLCNKVMPSPTLLSGECVFTVAWLLFANEPQ